MKPLNLSLAGLTAAKSSDLKMGAILGGNNNLKASINSSNIPKLTNINNNMVNNSHHSNMPDALNTIDRVAGGLLG